MAENQSYRAWISAIRPRTLPLALASILMGSFMAASNHEYDGWVLWLAGLTTVCLQILSNLANDYGDSVHGADHSDREGPKRSVQMGLITPREMRTGIWITSLLAFLLGTVLLIHVFSTLNAMMAVFLFLGIGAIFAALGYTIGKNPYGYAGLGDLFVLVFFGLVGVLGTYFLHTQKLQWQQVLPALSTGFLATAVLNVNNIRDIDSDRHAGKKSIPVRIGRQNAFYYHIFLLTGALVTATLYMSFHFQHLYQFAYLITTPLFYQNILDIKKKTRPDLLDPSLKKLSLSILLFTLLFGFGLILH
jgi:1,4-dihydroxy-2-naphthoate octaprenyltransferase